MFCYTDPGVCVDGQASGKVVGGEWSLLACGAPGAFILPAVVSKLYDTLFARSFNSSAITHVMQALAVSLSGYPGIWVSGYLGIWYLAG